jgi:hypothetical protein
MVPLAPSLPGALGLGFQTWESTNSIGNKRKQQRDAAPARAVKPRLSPDPSKFLIR